jgi:hypothetical protein
MKIDAGWILFLEKNPQFYELSKGDFFILFLEKISQGTTKFIDLKSIFPEIEEKDFETIMDSLVKLKVVSRTEAGGDVFFNVTPIGKELLSTWKKTHKFYST